jgi:hypothetical protein
MALDLIAITRWDRTAGAAVATSPSSQKGLVDQ